MSSKREIVEKMENYLRNNMEEARDILAQINIWDGSLEELAVYDMSDFDYIIESSDLPPTELIDKKQIELSKNNLAWTAFELIAWEIRDELENAMEFITDSEGNEY